MGSQVWSLVSLGVGLNVVLGAIVTGFRLPLYLDSLGTVFVAALVGPVAGALTGICSVGLLGLASPTAFAFIPVACVLGLTAGVAACWGSFKSPATTVLAGLVAGFSCAAVSAPIAATVFGGVTGGGTDLFVAFFRAGGSSPLRAAFLQSLMVDPLDKVVTFLLVFVLLRMLPRRALAAFPLFAKLPQTTSTNLESRYRAFTSSSEEPLSQPTSRSEQTIISPKPSGTSLLYQADPPEKTVALVLLLASIAATSDLTTLTLGLCIVVGSHFLVDSRTGIHTARRVLYILVPLGLSLVLINGLIVGTGEPTVLWMGLHWSTLGLDTAARYVLKVGTSIFILGVYIQTTRVERFTDFLLGLRVPYPLLYVVLMGGRLGPRLKERWKIAEEAQLARGLSMASGGMLDRATHFYSVLSPALGALFAELPQRAAALESRGFLSQRRRTSVPKAWLKDQLDSTWPGRSFYLWLSAIGVLGLLWALT